MSVLLKSRADVETPLPPPLGAAHLESLRTVAGGSGIVASTRAENRDFRHLLECLAEEDCAHSWRNFDVRGSLDGLLSWENELRPTEIFFFFLDEGRGPQLIAAGAVAERLTRGFPAPGLCVLGRCYILPGFRGRGFYRHILRYRLEHCRLRYGDGLKAIHIGSTDERVARVLRRHGFVSWPTFTHLGQQELRVAEETKLVDAYLLLLPGYVRRLRRAVAGSQAPEAVVALRQALLEVESAGQRNLGARVQEALETSASRSWFEQRDASELEELLLFCRSIPLVGFG